MCDSDGPVIARAVYRQKKEDMTERDPSLEKFRFASSGVHGVTAHSLAYIVDDIARELRANGAPAEQWATFVHIGV